MHIQIDYLNTILVFIKIIYKQKKKKKIIFENYIRN